MSRFFVPLPCMDTRVIKVGTSLGLIIPKIIARDIGLQAGTPIEVKLKDDRMIVTRKVGLKAGWAEAFAAYANEGEDEMLLPDYLDAEADTLL